jgi:hypothetical protein
MDACPNNRATPALVSSTPPSLQISAIHTPSYPLDSLSLFRPLRNLDLILARPPLLDKRQKLRLSRDIFLQHLWHVESLRGLKVLEEAAEGALGSAEGAVEGVDVVFAGGGLLFDAWGSEYLCWKSVGGCDGVRG